jgi:hypothetical protein
MPQVSFPDPRPDDRDDDQSPEQGLYITLPASRLTVRTRQRKRPPDFREYR